MAFALKHVQTKCRKQGPRRCVAFTDASLACLSSSKHFTVEKPLNLKVLHITMRTHKSHQKKKLMVTEIMPTARATTKINTITVCICIHTYVTLQKAKTSQAHDRLCKMQRCMAGSSESLLRLGAAGNDELPNMTVHG